jgi:predicted nucleic acid-binding protein
MIVVSDATPLRHLIAIGRADLLAELFGKVIVPTAVLGELQHDSTPAMVRTWADRLPGWVEVRSPSDSRLPAGGSGLDGGEKEAICITLELKADLLLIDDRAGREYEKRKAAVYAFG